ncbi:MAG: hypothetical protein AAFU78_20930 [Cyanobacteria bacterium J06633_2]
MLRSPTAADSLSRAHVIFVLLRQHALLVETAQRSPLDNMTMLAIAPSIDDAHLAIAFLNTLIQLHVPLCSRVTICQIGWIPTED